jgi:hypothetical protein
MRTLACLTAPHPDFFSFEPGCQETLSAGEPVQVFSEFHVNSNQQRPMHNMQIHCSVYPWNSCLSNNILLNVVQLTGLYQLADGSVGCIRKEFKCHIGRENESSWNFACPTQLPRATVSFESAKPSSAWNVWRPHRNNNAGQTSYTNFEFALTPKQVKQLTASWACMAWIWLHNLVKADPERIHHALIMPISACMWSFLWIFKT